MNVGGNRGSLMVEAAVVYPIMIVLIAGMISWGASHYNSVHEDVTQKLDNRARSMKDGAMDKKETEWIRGLDVVGEALL